MKTLKVVLTKNGSVTLVIKERWGRTGPVRDTRQVTFSRNDFEQALHEADIVVPWQEASR